LILFQVGEIVERDFAVAAIAQLVEKFVGRFLATATQARARPPAQHDRQGEPVQTVAAHAAVRG